MVVEQLNIRATDVDDLIMNTLGTILGFILFKILSIIFKKLSNKTMVEEYNKKDSIIKYGPYLYIGIAVISVFFSQKKRFKIIKSMYYIAIIK